MNTRSQMNIHQSMNNPFDMTGLGMYNNFNANPYQFQFNMNPIGAYQYQSMNPMNALSGMNPLNNLNTTLNMQPSMVNMQGMNPGIV
jgi:hypothetical protein